MFSRPEAEYSPECLQRRLFGLHLSELNFHCLPLTKQFFLCSDTQYRAPGGYSAAVLKLHPNAEIYGLTLSESNGGVSIPSHLTS